MYLIGAIFVVGFVHEEAIRFSLNFRLCSNVVESILSSIKVLF